MDIKETTKLIYRKKFLVFWLTVLGAVLAFDLAVIQTPKYEADFRILLVQKQMAGQDIYAISKSAQYLCQILKEGIYSDSFVEQLKIDEEIENEKQWEKMVKVAILRDLAIMEVAAFSEEKESAEEIGQAIAQNLVDNHQFYHGAGENVEIKILDKPAVSQKPFSLNLWLSSLIGALTGFLIGLVWILRKDSKQEKFSF